MNRINSIVADLLNWLGLGSILADTNDLRQFGESNHTQDDARFYPTPSH